MGQTEQLHSCETCAHRFLDMKKEPCNNCLVVCGFGVGATDNYKAAEKGVPHVPGTESKVIRPGEQFNPETMPGKVFHLAKPGEAVDHPAHYNRGKIEVIDYLEDCMTPEAFEGFLQGNVLKYMSRYQLKNGLEDLKKADWYLDYLIDFKKRQQANQD